MTRLGAVIIEVLAYISLSESEAGPTRCSTLQPFLSEVTLLPTQPKIQSLTIGPSSPDVVYPICSSLASMEIELLGFEDESGIFTHDVEHTAIWQEPLNLEIPHLVVRSQKNHLTHLLRLIMRVEETRSVLVQPFSASKWTIEALFGPPMSPLHSLTWYHSSGSGMGTWPASLSHLRRIHASSTPDSLALLRANYATLQEITLVKVRPAEVSAALHTLTRCESLSVLDFGISLIYLDQDIDTLRLLESQVEDLRARGTDVKLRLDITTHGYLDECLSPLTTLCRYIHRLYIDQSGHPTYSGYPSIREVNPPPPDLESMTFPRLTYLSITISDTMIHNDIPQPLLAVQPDFEAFMPALSTIHAEMVTCEAGYTSSLARTLSAGCFPHLESFDGSFHLLQDRDQSAYNWEEGSGLECKQELMAALDELGVQHVLEFKLMQDR